MRSIAEQYAYEGYEKGIEKEKINNAAKLLAKGLDFKLIEDITGLSRQKLVKLKSKITA